jgi:hypothetical protein
MGIGMLGRLTRRRGPGKAQAYQRAGRLGEAIELFEQVRAAMIKELGAEHPHTLTTLNNLAGAYKAAGRLNGSSARRLESRNPPTTPPPAA